MKCAVFENESTFFDQTERADSTVNAVDTLTNQPWRQMDYSWQIYI